MTDSHLTELVMQAMNGQRRAIRLYELLAAAAPRPRDRELLQAVRREERRHYYLLEGIYEDMTGESYAPPPPSLTLPRNYVEMLKCAMRDKLAAIDFYADLTERVACVRSRQLLELIFSDQKEHTRILVALYDKLI